MANYNWPINPTTVNSGPVQFEIDGIPNIVNIDTGTPANSTPLPVIQYGPTGIPFDPTKQQSAFILDSVETVVEQDTVTPGNSIPFPVAQLNTDGTVNDPLKKQVAFIRNGTEVVVTEDTVTPGNNLPLPVKLTSVTGDINITAGDLNVQLSDQGASPDVTRIGDGTNQLGMTAANEAKVNAAQLPTVLGQTTKANSLSVTLPSDLDPIVVRSGLVPTEYDEIALTYVGAGLDGEGQVATAVYKLATVTVATLTLSYDSADKLVGVVRS